MAEVILLGDLELDWVTDIEIRQTRHLAAQSVPGWDGDLVQDLGERSARISIRGLAVGEEASGRLEELRTLFKEGAPIDFVSSAAVATDIDQTLLEHLDVVQRGGVQSSYAYALTLRRYVPPPPPSTGGFADSFLEDIGALDVTSALDSVGGLADALGTAEAALNEVNKAIELVDEAIGLVEGALEFKELLEALGGVASAAG